MHIIDREPVSVKLLCLQILFCSKALYLNQLKTGLAVLIYLVLIIVRVLSTYLFLCFFSIWIYIIRIPWYKPQFLGHLNYYE